MPVSDAGRPRTRLPRSERRAQLLQAAHAVFSEVGYHAAAMDDIADRAGVSKPVLYQHFPGKLELYLALMDMHVDGVVARIERAFESSTDNRERLHAAVVGYFDWVAGGDGGYQVVFGSDLRNDAQVNERVERARDACTRLIARTLKQSTGIDDARAQLLGLSLVGISVTMASAYLTMRDAISREDAIETMMALLWKGLAGLPAVAAAEPQNAVR